MTFGGSMGGCHYRGKKWTLTQVTLSDYGECGFSLTELLAFISILTARMKQAREHRAGDMTTQSGLSAPWEAYS